MDNQFTPHGFKNLIKNHTDKSVSNDAATALGQETTDKREQIAEKALQNAQEDGRKTVRKTDIRKAAREMTTR